MVKYEVVNNIVRVMFNYDPDYVTRIKQVPGARWNPEEKVWQIPAQHIDKFRQLFDGEIIEDRLPDFHADIVKQEVGTAVPLYEFQKFGASFLAQRAAQNGFAFLCDATGIGKGHPVDTNILTPAGWRRIGDLRVGDKVIGSNGQAVTVTGVFRRGILPVYRVTFNDSCSILVDADHVWAVRTGSDQHRGRNFYLKTTRELMNDLTYSNGYCKWRIPLVAPVQFQDSGERPIDPYVLGVLLADGCFSGHTVRFTPGDKHVAEEVASLLPPGLSLTEERGSRSSSTTYCISSGKPGASNPILDALRQLGLMGLRSHERFVPRSYLFAPVEDRIALLQGLLDSDGEFYVGTNHVGFCTTSLRLAEAVTFLVQSLGGVVWQTIKRSPKYRHNGELRVGKQAYLLSIRLPDSITPFRIRKLPPLKRPRKYLPNRIIRSIEPAGQAEVICIAVDAPDQLYVTEHFIVTHNTPQSLGAWLLLKDMLGTEFLPTLVVTPAAVRHQWVVDAIPKFLGSDTDVVEVVGTQQQRLVLYGTAEITVVNYEALMRDAELIPKDTKFALFIFDECQRLKNKSGVTYRAVKKLLKRMPGAFKFFLTATPLMNNLDELYALFELAQPGFFGKYSQFKQEHMKVIWTGRYPKLVGYKKLGVIAQQIAPHILRRTAEHPEVAAALPEFVEQVLYVEPSSLQRQLHDLIHDDWLKTQQELATLEGPAREQVEARCRGQIVLMQGAADDPRLFTMSSSRQTEYYLEHVGNIPDSPSPKLQALCELVNDLVPDGKVVIFTCFERMARLIHGALQQYNPALFTGKNKAEREVELKRFWQDPSCKVIVMTDAGGVGLNIQIARFLINFDLPWSPGQLEQRYGRIKRFGSQYRSVVVFNMLTLGTIDERIMQALQRKQEVFAALVHAYNHEPLV